MKAWLSVLTLVLLLGNFGCSNQPKVSKPKVLNREQAVQAAEEFIIQNGYTDLPPIADRSKLSVDSIEGILDTEQILKLRHNTLERKAYGFVDDNKGKPGWTIVFKYKKLRSNKIGRAVTMDLNGEKKWMEHQDIFLSVCKKL